MGNIRRYWDSVTPGNAGYFVARPSCRVFRQMYRGVAERYLNVDRSSGPNEKGRWKAEGWGFGETYYYGGGASNGGADAGRPVAAKDGRRFPRPFNATALHRARVLERRRAGVASPHRARGRTRCACFGVGLGSLPAFLFFSSCLELRKWRCAVYICYNNICRATSRMPPAAARASSALLLYIQYARPQHTQARLVPLAP